jgi:hypothetical protein
VTQRQTGPGGSGGENDHAIKEKLKWNYLVGFALIAGAVFFVFKKW